MLDRRWGGGVPNVRADELERAQGEERGEGVDDGPPPAQGEGARFSAVMTTRSSLSWARARRACS
jgi:hypothetical protein